MYLPLFILKTKPPPPPPIANVVITEVTLFLPLFFVLQVLFVMFCLEKNHREKLILLFSNSMLAVVYCIYAMIATHLERIITICVVLCALEFLIVLASQSEKEKEKEKEKSRRRSSTRRLNAYLVVAWVAVLILILSALFSREIRLYF